MSEEACSWLASQQDAMLAMMEKVVNIDSGSYDKAGVDAVGEVFADFFRSHDIDVERLPSSTAGDIFRASRKRADRPDGPSRHGVRQR
jgi:glutamate carboxypeptidase